MLSPSTMSIERSFRLFSCVCILQLFRFAWTDTDFYTIDSGNGFGRRFDGIGAISGGGATSKLLHNYPEKQRSEILDFLFKPTFGASLQILKVEIGGDSQSTDGVEASHMRSASDVNYHRGYEWWLMTEAKKRNADIVLYALPWVFPGWLHAREPYSPFSNRTNLVTYMTSWLRGAKHVHNLTIDYIGIWNERPYDIEFIKMLRSAMDSQGLEHVKIVAPDSADWEFIKDFLRDRDLARSTDVIGIHYPGSVSPYPALSTDRPLWASEDFSCFNDLAGGGCWARVLNEGYVNGFFTGFVAWNLITSYYDGLPYQRSSLMTANEPWSGHYTVAPPIWMSAHYTQFTRVGWRYLARERGSGWLDGNGTYVALMSPDGSQLTIVIETINPGDAPCFYPMPSFPVAPVQQGTFQLRGQLKSIKRLYVWRSRLDFTRNLFTAHHDSDDQLFERQPPLQVVDGRFSLKLRRNEVYTLTTLDWGVKGSYPPPPLSKPFPLPYVDDFEGYPISAEPDNLTPQAGSWEVVDSGSPKHGQVIGQTVLQPPIDTCRPLTMPRPIALIGSYRWADLRVAVDVRLVAPPVGSAAVFVALRLSAGGCEAMNATGLFLWLSAAHNSAYVTANYNRTIVYREVAIPVHYSQWYHIELVVKGDKVSVSIDSSPLMSIIVRPMPSQTGFAAIGTENFATAFFDNLRLTTPDYVKTMDKVTGKVKGRIIKKKKPGFILQRETTNSIEENTLTAKEDKFMRDKSKRKTQLYMKK